MSAPDAEDPLFPLYAACAITTALFTLACVVTVAIAHVRYARVARGAAPLGGLFEGLAPAWYAGSLAFGMGGIVAGFYLLRSPRTARQGYACVVLGALHVVALVVLTCAGLVLFVRAYGPRLPLLDSGFLGETIPIVPSPFRSSIGA